MRGYGGTDRPVEIEKYTLLHLVGDVVGVLDALKVEKAAIVGHDWGAPVAWCAALLRPDRFRGVAGLSVPFLRRGFGFRTSQMPRTETAQFYQLYFQPPGVAEAELERDPRETIRRLLYSGSGDVPRKAGLRPATRRPGMVPRNGGFLTRSIDPPALPAWLTEADVDFYAGEFARMGFRGGLNWYRNIDRNWELMAPFDGLRVDNSRALYRGRTQLGDQVPGARKGDRQSKDLCSGTPGNAHAAGLRPLDATGASGRGQRGDHRVLAGTRLSPRLMAGRR